MAKSIFLTGTTLIFTMNNKSVMSTVSGIRIRKSKAGKTTHVAIDVRKNPQAIDLLRGAGLLPKTALQKEAEKGFTVDEVFDEIQQQIIEHYANRHPQPADEKKVK